jgi:sugar porter (SP) family MFS transporter
MCNNIEMENNVQSQEMPSGVEKNDKMGSTNAMSASSSGDSVYQVLLSQKKTFAVALFSALGGFLFGLDIGYIGPILEMNSFRNVMNDGNAISSGDEALIVALFGIGAIISTFPPVNAFLMDKFGRKWNIIGGAILFAVGAIIQAVASVMWLFEVGRVVGGMAVGVMSVASPMYQTEVSPRQTRGALVALYQLAITFGILVANLIAKAFENDNDDGFRLTLWPQVGIAAFLAIGMFFMPESPRHLLMKDKKDPARDVLFSLRKGADHGAIEAEYTDMCSEVDTEKSMGESSWREFGRGYLLRLALVGATAQILQQLNGMNAFMYYGVKLFKLAGIDGFTFQIVQSSVNFGMTIPAIFLVDKLGRTILLKIGAIGMTIMIWTLGIVGQIMIIIPDSCPTSETNDKYDCAHQSGYADGDISGAVSATVIVTVLGFVSFFAISWGPIIWAFCAEIFPNKYRAKGVAITTCCNWIGNTIVGYVTPIMLDHIGFSTFFFYGSFCILCVIFAFWIIETARISLEHMTPLWEKKLHCKFHEGANSSQASPETSADNLQRNSESAKSGEPASESEQTRSTDKSRASGEQALPQIPQQSVEDLKDIPLEDKVASPKAADGEFAF